MCRRRFWANDFSLRGAGVGGESRAGPVVVAGAVAAISRGDLSRRVVSAGAVAAVSRGGFWFRFVTPAQSTATLGRVVWTGNLFAAVYRQCHDVGSGLRVVSFRWVPVFGLHAACVLVGFPVVCSPFLRRAKLSNFRTSVPGDPFTGTSDGGRSGATFLRGPRGDESELLLCFGASTGWECTFDRTVFPETDAWAV